MSHIKLRGFIIKEIPLGESDRLINILSPKLGLISAIARGARRAKSRLLAPTQVFTLADFELFAYKGRYTVDDIQIIESFSRMREDIERLICASHLAEVLLDCTRDGVAEPGIYQLWAYSLAAVQEHDDPLLVVHVAQLRLLAEIGFALHIDSCVSCGAAIFQPQDREKNHNGNVFFSIAAGGCICRKTACRKNDGRPVGRAVLQCLWHCQNSPVPKLYNFSLSQTARNEFFRLSADFLVSQMEKNYTRLKMLDDLASIRPAPRNRAAKPEAPPSPGQAVDATLPETADDKSADHSDRRSGE